MSTYLQFDAEQLKATNSYWTAREISQQPAVWRAAQQQIEQQADVIERFLAAPMAFESLRVVLVGAGTSAFIGDAIAPYLRKQLGKRVEALSSTDLLASPELYLEADKPTIMVSFGRSGDSPESMAAVNLGNQFVDNIYHLTLTCNPDGALARFAAEDSSGKSLCLLMPEGSHDQSFAMTSSYSSMMLSCLSVFGCDMAPLQQVIGMAEYLIENSASVRELALRPFNRMVVLGAGVLRGIAKEAALKMLELSAGQVVALDDSSLGFRHGPKSVVDQNTLIIPLRSNNPYTQQYDDDLLDELKSDNQAMAINGLSATALFPSAVADASIDDVWMGLVYITYCQMLAFYKAMALGINADNPCPTGEVNRVVQGVTLYPHPMVR